MNAKTAPRGGSEDLAGGLGSETKSGTGSRISHAATPADVLAGRREPHELDNLLHALWVDGFFAGSDARASQMQPRLDAVNREADRLWFELNNPAEVKAQTALSLQLFDAARGRITEARHTEILRTLQRTDPVEQKRLLWLNMTDRPAYIAAIAEHEKAVANA